MQIGYLHLKKGFSDIGYHFVITRSSFIKTSLPPSARARISTKWRISSNLQVGSNDKVEPLPHFAFQVPASKWRALP